MGRWDYNNYTPSTPRPVKGGIKAGGRETGGKNWWAKRWIKVLESFDIGARLGRGRTYARRGQVISVNIGKGLVTAQVQGSRVRPYKVSIKIKQLSPEQWQRVIDILAAEALYSAKMLSGEMPADIEEVFSQAGVSLFPEQYHDLETDCSCPDWSNPCKHIAAVYYILGQEFDQDPFLIFKLRGLEREEIMGQLAKTEAHPDIPEYQPEPLPLDHKAFWVGEELPEDFLAGTILPSSRAAILQRMGNFPLWRGKESLEKSLKPVYIKASDLGLNLATGEKPGCD